MSCANPDISLNKRGFDCGTTLGDVEMEVVFLKRQLPLAVNKNSQPSFLSMYIEWPLIIALPIITQCAINPVSLQGR